VKIDDYLNFGVAMFGDQPRSRRAWIYTKSGIQEAKDGLLRTENPSPPFLLPTYSPDWTNNLEPAEQLRERWVLTARAHSARFLNPVRRRGIFKLDH